MSHLVEDFSDVYHELLDMEDVDAALGFLEGISWLAGHVDLPDEIRADLESIPELRRIL